MRKPVDPSDIGEFYKNKGPIMLARQSIKLEMSLTVYIDTVSTPRVPMRLSRILLSPECFSFQNVYVKAPNTRVMTFGGEAFQG